MTDLPKGRVAQARVLRQDARQEDVNGRVGLALWGTDGTATLCPTGAQVPKAGNLLKIKGRKGDFFFP